MAITDQDIKKMSEVFVTKQELKEVKDSVDKLRETQESFIKKVENINEDRKVELLQYQRQESKLENHENRRTLLEAKV